jgi:hypothetical protein
MTIVIVKRTSKFGMQAGEGILRLTELKDSVYRRQHTSQFSSDKRECTFIVGRKNGIDEFQ